MLNLKALMPRAVLRSLHTATQENISRRMHKPNKSTQENVRLFTARQCTKDRSESGAPIDHRGPLGSPVKTAQHKDSIREATSESGENILATVHAAEIHESGKLKKMRLNVANYTFIRFESHDVVLHTADWHQISATTQLPALLLLPQAVSPVRPSPLPCSSLSPSSGNTVH